MNIEQAKRLRDIWRSSEKPLVDDCGVEPSEHGQLSVALDELVLSLEKRERFKQTALSIGMQALAQFMQSQQRNGSGHP